jgi:GNAT superfamily N-acetyltransferase
MDNIQIKPIEANDKDWISSILEKQWGSVNIITRGKSYQADKLPGYIAVLDDKKIGLITYHMTNDCEIITLDSFVQGKGIGTALVEKVKETAKGQGCKRVWLITTNDNLEALRFCQKRGFILSALYPNALEQSRKIKPEIPRVGIDGIPLRDEIELEIKLN